MTKKKWDPDFKKYMEFIVKHPNYEGMPEVYNKNKKIKWVTTGNSKLGKKRRAWWKEKAKENNIKRKGHWLSKTAREIHPTKEKPCQICGKVMKINFVYPNKTTIKQLNKIKKLNIHFKFDDFKEINEVVNIIVNELGKESLKELKKIFSIPSTIKKSKLKYIDYIINNCGKKGSGKLKLSPGVMSNAPDRFDGFHSYNKCCRKEHDTGRHSENMSRYIQDRRAYEHWAEGDWKAASSLMGQVSEKGVCKICDEEGLITADHIGPISLGFAHRPKFQPLCRTCNSAKNNRMFLKDVQTLIKDEKNGQKVVSFHTKPLWDKLKNKVNSEKGAKKLSNLLRKNHHHFLELFYRISEKEYNDFLLNYLNPEYAYYSAPNFINLNKKNFKYKRIEKSKGNIKNYQNNAARYIAIAFESLREYHIKANRKWKFRKELQSNVNKILTSLENFGNYNMKLREILNKAINEQERDIEKFKIALKEDEKLKSRNKRADQEIKNFFIDLSEILEKMY